MNEILGSINIVRGRGYPITLMIRENTPNGNYIDLTGYSFRMAVTTLQAPVDNSTLLFELNGVVDPDQVTNTGKVVFTIDPTETDTMPGTYFYEIMATYGPGDMYKRTFAMGEFIINQSRVK